MQRREQHSRELGPAWRISPPALLVLVVNAQVFPPYPWAISGDEPGIYSTLASSFDAAFNTLTAENIAQARRELMMWERITNRNRPAKEATVKVYFSNLTFSQIGDSERREKHHALPNANLSTGQVDSLVDVAADLLEQSEPFHEFINDVNRGVGKPARTGTQP